MNFHSNNPQNCYISHRTLEMLTQTHQEPHPYHPNPFNGFTFFRLRIIAPEWPGLPHTLASVRSASGFRRPRGNQATEMWFRILTCTTRRLSDRTSVAPLLFGKSLTLSRYPLGDTSCASLLVRLLLSEHFCETVKVVSARLSNKKKSMPVGRRVCTINSIVIVSKFEE